MFFIAQAQSQNWAFLVAGSRGYWNYRHQADVCHAFQVIKKNGIPLSNIIVMMYDDIANNSLNPKKGTITNCIGCPNVYTPDIPKDYTGENVSAENFLKILRGENMTGIGSGKTLNTGPNDRIFVFWSDHGGPGVLAFPNSMLHASDLFLTLEYMYNAKRYKEMVFYIEACESGSMFNGILPRNWNIYATTASNPFESSFACFYDGLYRAYLSDCYSFNWINNTENNNVWNITLGEQYKVVKTKTTESHVCQYGDMSLSSRPIGLFQGWTRKIQIQRVTPGYHSIPSYKVKEDVLTRVLKEELSSYERTYYSLMLYKHRLNKVKTDAFWSNFSKKFHLKQNNSDNCNSNPVNFSCMKNTVESIIKHCGMISEETIWNLNKIRDACEVNSSQNLLTYFYENCSVLSQ